jgi:hypothetical protein
MGMKFVIIFQKRFDPSILPVIQLEVTQLRGSMLNLEHEPAQM